MISIRSGKDRGHANHGWLDSHHTFSFANYHDPQHMGFRSLRVINDDRVTGGAGFPTHGHRDMEILSYVVDGGLEHRDSMGNGGVVRPGDVQRMTAGTGVSHSEFNASKSDPLRFLQIWIIPDRRGLEPGYQQKHFGIDERTDQLKLVASEDGRGGSVLVHQDVAIYASTLGAGRSLEYTVAGGRHAWLQVVNGNVHVAGHALEEGDGLAQSGSGLLELRADRDCEFLLFDLA